MFLPALSVSSVPPVSGKALEGGVETV